MCGRPEAAAAAKLTIVAAGPAEANERCRPLFEAMGEAFALARKHGIDPARFIEIVNGRLLRSPVYENYARIITEERYEPAGFKLRHGLKDARLALAAGDEVEVALPIAGLVRDHDLSPVAWGWGDIDWAALARVSAVDAGLESFEGRPT